MTVLKISARTLDPTLKYNPFPIIYLNQEKQLQKASFLAQTIEREVMSGTPKEQLKKLKILKKTFKIYASILSVVAVTTINKPLFAEENPNIHQVFLTDNQIGELNPSQVMEWGMKLALMTVGIGMAMGIVLLVTAGIYRMLRKKREATEWTTDIIKGLVQVLVAIPTVLGLFYLALKLFKRLPILEGLL